MRRKNSLISKMDGDQVCDFEFRMPLSLRKYWIFPWIFAFCQQFWNEIPLNLKNLFTPAFVILGFKWPSTQWMYLKIPTINLKRFIANGEKSILSTRIRKTLTLSCSNNRRKRQKRRRRRIRVSIARVTPLSDSQFSYENENGAEVETQFHYSTKLFYDCRIWLQSTKLSPSISLARVYCIWLRA